MSTDKKPEDQITEAGAVELDETQLDDAAGGVIAITPAPSAPPEYKYNPVADKWNPGGTPSPEQKVRG